MKCPRERVNSKNCLKAPYPRKLDPKGHREPPAELRATAYPEDAVTVLREECRVLVWRGDIIRSARSTGEHHDVPPGAVAIEVQGDLRPLGDVV